MAQVINLNRARKDRAKVQKAAASAENRIRYGRTKADKASEKARAELAERRHEGHRKAEDEPEKS